MKADMPHLNADSGAFRRFRRRLIAAIVLLLVLVSTIAVFFNLSFGWFTNNKTVSSNGITVRAGTYESLIIASDAESVTGQSDGNPDLWSLSVSSDVVSLSAAASTDSTPCRLRYLTTPKKVDPLTGLPRDGAEFAEAVAGVHYIDFVSFIGTSGADFSFYNFTVSWDPEETYFKCEKDGKFEEGVNYYAESDGIFAKVNTTGFIPGMTSVADYYTHEVQYDTHRAVCVDIYLGSEFKGTLKIADSSNKVTLLDTPGKLTTDRPIEVTARVYFDGESTNGDGRCYIRSSDIVTSGIVLGLKFKAPSR